MAEVNKSEDITLTLSDEEAKNLLVYLSLHSLDSVIDTYPVFEVLHRHYPDVVTGKKTMDLMERTRLSHGSLFKIAESAG